MSHLDYAALFLLIGIMLISLTVIWQMYVVLTEIHTLDRYTEHPKLPLIASSVFFSFSLSLYYFCPNARKKGIVFLILGISGLLCYGLGMYFKRLAMNM
ncbi:MAG: hypothetical protein Q4B82_06060 [Alysiella sp.]|uniref:hypothetical protein n=1 Tax=Alysiella sp. TaxID=1872483 RepID=UPI0026DAB1AB|nr:hypothetical protein [Alysiella sp.]MDO4434126.1 hypothetical protein [Alysiella sp.]